MCTLNVLSYGIRTDFVKPDGSHVVKITGAVVGLPALVDADNDLLGLPDVMVTLTPAGTSKYQLQIQRLLTAPAAMPVSVEALVADPSSTNRVVNVGYDARATNAPAQWTASASLTTGTTTTVKAGVHVQNPPPSMATIGGIYDAGPNGARLNPKQARLNYTPVPANSTISLSIGAAADSAQVGADSPSRADFELRSLDGTSGQHITGTLANLQKPVGLLFDSVDATGAETAAPGGNPHVQLTTQGDVASSAVTYEQITAAQVMLRAHISTGTLPARTDFTSTPSGFIASTSSALDVAGGVSLGVPASGGTPAIPVPAGYPIESAENSYVHQDTTGGIGSTTFRIGGVQYANVATTGAVNDRVIALTGRVQSAPLHVLITNDAAPGGTTYDATINVVPHNFYARIALAETRIITFCGSSSDAPDPCGAAGQAAPAGIGSIVLNPSHSPTPLFGRATNLSGVVTAIPATLALDLSTHVPAGPADPNQDTKVYLDASQPIGEVLLRATDGSAPPADPADNGLIYLDTPAHYAVLAKIDGITSAHLDTAPNLAVTLSAAAGHGLSYSVDLPSDAQTPARHFDGVITARPATIAFSLANQQGQPLTVHVAGSDSAGNPTGTGAITLNARNLSADPASKVHNIRVALTGVPPALDLVKQPPSSPTDTSINMTAGTSGGALGVADVELDNGIVPDPASVPALPLGGGGAIVYSGGGQFFVHAHVLQLRGVSVATAPDLSAGIDVAVPQDFRVYVNTGLGTDATVPNGCDGFDPSQHNGAHIEYNDVLIRGMQPHTAFRYETHNDGNPDPCKVKSWRIVDYTAAGRADSISFDTDSGDMAHLHVLVGQSGPNPLQVPGHLRACQGGNDKCLAEIGRTMDCHVGGVHYDYCSTPSADQTVYLETYGQRTHVDLGYCSLNNDPGDHSTCTQDSARKGVFVNLNLNHMDTGYHFNTDNGFGFFTLNTNSPVTHINQGMNGFLRYVDHTGHLEFLNMQYGYDAGLGVPPWDPAQGSTWDNYLGAITFAAPLVGSKQGSAGCINPAYGVTWNDSSSYLHAILDAAGAGPNDLGDNLTNLLCGLI